MYKKIIISLLVLGGIGIGVLLLSKPASSPVPETTPDILVETPADTTTYNQVTTPSTNTMQEHPTAIVTTTKGTIEIELFADAAPQTVKNFTDLASEGFYNGTRFHRVIAGFMIQGGDPLSKDDSMMMRWGTGGPGYQFADEIHANNANVVGTISMANAGPNTNGSQFFINTADNGFLDTKHTVFGKVVKGMDVVTAIENTPTGQADRPVEPITITGITIK